MHRTGRDAGRFARHGVDALQHQRVRSAHARHDHASSRRGRAGRLSSSRQSRHESESDRSIAADNELMTDVRYAFRQLIKSPSFSATAIFALALGIGATTAMFAVIYAFLSRPLPYADPEKLVMLQSRSTRSGSDLGVNYLDFVDWQKAKPQLFRHGVFQSALERKSRAERRRYRDAQDHLHDCEPFQSPRRAARVGPQPHRR